MILTYAEEFSFYTCHKQNDNIKIPCKVFNTDR